MFIEGQTYSRAWLHQNYGGQQQSGISTPSQHRIIFLFTGETGAQYGYSDSWTEDGLFLYTGEGQVGDMTFVRGNAAIRDHLEDGKDLHLFGYVGSGLVRYIGQMVCTGFHYQPGPDRGDQTRNLIIFELAPVRAAIEVDNPSHDPRLLDEPSAGSSLAELRAKALADPSDAVTPGERKILYRHRSLAIKLYALKRANGICEGCGQPAPFQTPEGSPYLEVHHIQRLSDGGPDRPEAVVAVCPNCHRRAHYAHDGEAFNRRLSRIARSLEGSSM